MNKSPAPKVARKTFDADFKRRVLDHWKSTGRPAAVIASEFGVSVFTLYDWRKKQHPCPHGGMDAAALAERVRELEQELAASKERCDILKKSLGILCEPPRKSMPTSKR